jgi:cytochrome b
MTAMRFERKRVYDPVLRSIHAWNAVVLLLLLLGGRLGEWLGRAPEAAYLWRLHVWVGYGLVLGLVARVTWGVVGPETARLADLWRPLAWWQALKTRAWFTEPTSWGHHAPATLAYLGFYLVLIAMAVTGLALAAVYHGGGPLGGWLGHDIRLKHLFREPHEWLENVVLAFVLVHIAMLILHEVRHGVPIAQAMVSGFQYRKDEPAAPVEKEET